MTERVETEVVIYPPSSTTPGLVGEVVRGGPFEEQMRRQEAASPEARAAAREEAAERQRSALEASASPVTVGRLRFHKRQAEPP
jgi:hypothetical protein